MVHRHVHVVITALATAATVLTGGACATPAVTAPDRGPGAIDQAFGHVHGIELNPANGRFYAATHHGVFQLDPQEPVRVSERRDDTMAFTIAGHDQFLGSGHSGLANPGRPTSA